MNSAYKVYLYNNIVDTKTIIKDNNSKINKLGFNYEYSRWVPLTSYEIE